MHELDFSGCKNCGVLFKHLSQECRLDTFQWIGSGVGKEESGRG